MAERPRRLRTAGFGALTALAVVACGCSDSDRAGSLPPTPVPNAPRIVVLQLENVGPPESAYFAAGITDELIRRLAVVSGLAVVSRAGAHIPVRTEPALASLRAELDVRYVLHGEIGLVRGQDTVDGFWIEPHLIDLESNEQRWSQRFDRPMEGILDVQSELVKGVAGALAVPIRDVELERLDARPTSSLAAYDAYLQALGHCWSYELNELELAQRLLGEAIARDPQFAIAQAMLSETHSQIYHFRYDRSPGRLAAARAAVDQALALDPSIPEAHRALGFFYYWGHRNYDYSLAEFAQAAAARPNDSLILASMGIVHRRQGRWEDAVRELERAADLDPRSDINVQDLASTFARLRRYDEAERYCREAISLAPDDFYPYVYCARIARARDGTTVAAAELLQRMPSKDDAQQSIYRFEQALLARDLAAALDVAALLPETFSEPIDEETLTRSLAECHARIVLGAESPPPTACELARVYFERARETSPADASVHAALGWVDALTGRPGEAIAAGERAAELLPIAADAMAGPTVLEQLAKTYAWAGEPDLAIDTIEQCLAHPGWLSPGMLRLDPDWDPLRDHPRFGALVRGGTVDGRSVAR